LEKKTAQYQSVTVTMLVKSDIKYIFLSETYTRFLFLFTKILTGAFGLWGCQRLWWWSLSGFLPNTRPAMHP